MSAEARRRAERCFALARSTTFGPERETAIAKGTAIAEAAGLSLDLFDIPGRARPRKVPLGGYDPALFTGNGFMGDNFRYASVRAEDMLDAIRAAMEETLRNRYRAENAAEDRARRERAKHERKVSECLNWLFARGVRVYPSHRADDLSVVYLAPEERPGEELTEPDIVRLARARGWKG